VLIACGALMTLIAPVVTPPEQIRSRARPDARRYSIEQLFATRVVGGADWSPDGDSIVFVTNLSGRSNLWTVPASGGWPVQLTISEQRQASPTWSPDGQWIAFQSDHDADEQWDLFVVNPNQGAVVNLTNTPEISEESPVWSPDSRLLACAVKPRRSPNYEIALVDVAARVLRPLTRNTPADWSLHPVAFVPGGRWLLASRSHATGKNSDAVLVDLATGATRVLTAHEGEQQWSPSDVSSDGARVLLTSNAKNGFDNVALLDLETALAALAHPGAPPPVTWITGERWEASAGAFSPDGRRLVYSVNADGNGELYSFQPSSGRHERLEVGAGYATLSGARSPFSPEGARLLFKRSAPAAPGELGVYDLDAPAAKQITRNFEGGVDAGDMIEPYLVRYPSRDGLTVSAFLYVPWNLARDNSNPAIVWVHGGPTAQSLNDFNRNIQFFANHGYIVLAPNYRGSTGYGKDFMDANRYDMGGGDLADVLAGAELLKRTGFVDPKRIAIGGGSFGGYLTMMGVTRAAEVWAAGVAMFPFVNWFTELEHEDPLLRQYDLATMGDPVKDADRYRDRSPAFFLDRICAPLMLVAGANDPRCPASESQQVADAMKQRGTPCEFVLLPDEGHGFAKRENLFATMKRIVEFLDGALRK
jgi:dipeptidyl aminopeptidase/acylaminoacyl peptidase